MAASHTDVHKCADCGELTAIDYPVAGLTNFGGGMIETRLGPSGCNVTLGHRQSQVGRGMERHPLRTPAGSPSRWARLWPEMRSPCWREVAAQ